MRKYKVMKNVLSGRTDFNGCQIRLNIPSEWASSRVWNELYLGIQLNGRLNAALMG